MKDSAEIAKSIEENKEEILNKLDKESVDAYLFLSNEYKKGDVENNHLFQFVFRSYYRLDGAGLSPEQKVKYFKLLANPKVSLSEILDKLYELPTLRNRNSLQFSFATKLLHTIDQTKPIFDNDVATAVGSYTPWRKIKEERMTAFEKLYDDLRNLYSCLCKDAKVRSVIQEFRKKFEVNASQITDQKALDFILWSLGKLMQNRKSASSDKVV